MSSTRWGYEVLCRVAAWGLCCSLVASGLWLGLATASHSSTRYPENDDKTLLLEVRAAKKKTAHVASLQSKQDCFHRQEFRGNVEKELSENEKEDTFSHSLEARVAERKTGHVASLENKHGDPHGGEVSGNRDQFPQTPTAQVTSGTTALSASQTPGKGNSQTRVSRSLQSSRNYLNCLIKSTCSARLGQNQDQLADMFPCMCDDKCYLYGDCCQDHPSVGLPPPALRPSCKPLTPIAKRPYAKHRMVFLVDRCPAGTEPRLAYRCAGDGIPSYLMDIPVFSNTSGIGYANIFCAKCHNDTDIFEFKTSVSCTDSLNSTTELENMTYHSGELWWSSPSVGEDHYCLLDVAYPPYLGRWCHPGLVDTCRKDWPIEEHVRRCAAYNYYVQTTGDVYKNKDCALCNGVPEGDIRCLDLFRLGTRSWPMQLPSLMELFEVKGDCQDAEVWDVIYRRCEHVSCGFLFILVDGQCVRGNTTPADGRPYLNESCFVMEFSQNLSTIFPDQSIYLNETQRLYHIGEYESNGSWIRVCDEPEKWTPIMQVISSVLILISLVCLLLHMTLFIALPKRRNIPSMNLFSMTVSLFMAEFIFVTFFQLKINYVSCVITGVLLYYFLCVSFLWMNAMSIDIFRTFYSNTYRSKSRAVFTQYSLYAWLLPIGGVMVAVVVDQVWPEFIIAPHFGTDKCWMNNKWGLVAFFTFPSGMVILANLILYMVSVHNIYIQMKSGEMASSTIRKNGSSAKYSAPASKNGNSLKPSTTEKSSSESISPKCKERLRDRLNRGLCSRKQQRLRLLLYCKLALMMGMTWIFAFVSIHTKSVIFEYLFIVFNGLQGTFIFVSFDLKKKVWEELRYKMSRRGGSNKGDYRRPLNTTSTSFRIPPDSDYKYRWSSSRRSEGGHAHSTTHSISETQPFQEKAESEV